MRPAGVALIAALHWLRGFAYFLGGLAILGFTHLSARLMSAVTNDTPLARIASGLGKMLGIGLLIFAMFWIILGFGIWACKNRARFLTLVFAGLGLLFGLVRLAHIPTPWRMLRIVVDAAIIAYLLLPDVKRAFAS
jgi:uncharacterized membrane protein (DUF2068 family)